MADDDETRPAPGDIVAHDHGQGPALVLIHGIGSDSRAWGKIGPGLTARFRVLTVDLPGISLLHLADQPPSLTALAREVDAAMTSRDLDAYSIVGHSYGATVALASAQAFPTRVQTLTLVAPGGFGPEINPALRLMTSRTGGVLLRIAQTERVRTRVERVAKRYRARAKPARSIDELVDTYNRLSSREAQRHFRRSVASALDAKRALGSSTITAPDLPIQIIWGQDDLVLPVWQSQTASRLLRAQSVHVIAGAGHSPHRSHPEQVVRLISEFAGSST
jgi:pimeloyl-ACP methyl ester carboxylesterase